jgi:hypothetical protein
MRRREFFITFLGGAALAPAAFAQKAQRTFRVGQLLASPTTDALRLSAPFMPTLAEQGFVVVT